MLLAESLAEDLTDTDQCIITLASETFHGLCSANQCPVQRLLVVHLAHYQRGEVDGLHKMAQQRTLKAQHVPARNLVAARETVCAFALYKQQSELPATKQILSVSSSGCMLAYKQATEGVAVCSNQKKKVLKDVPSLASFGALQLSNYLQ